MQNWKSWLESESLLLLLGTYFSKFAKIRIGPLFILLVLCVNRTYDLKKIVLNGKIVHRLKEGNSISTSIEDHVRTTLNNKRSNFVGVRCLHLKDIENILLGTGAVWNSKSPERLLETWCPPLGTPNWSWAERRVLSALNRALVQASDSNIMDE